MDVEFEGEVFVVVEPGSQDLVNAQLNASKEFNRARQNGAILRDALSAYLEDQGVWTKEKQLELTQLSIELDEIIKELKKGKEGKYKKMSEARKAAIRARQVRYTTTALLAKSRELDTYTAESLAEQGRFDYLASVCIQRAGQTAFESTTDYLNHSSEGWVKKCALELSYMLYPDLDRNWTDKLPENRFLTKYKLVNEEGSLVNKEGKLVDEDFKLINDAGEWIDEDGKVVDVNGNKVDEDGDVIHANYEAFDNDLE